MEAALMTCGRQTDRQTDGHTDWTNPTLNVPFTITRTRLIKDRGKLRLNLEYAYFRNAVLSRSYALPHGPYCSFLLLTENTN